MRLTEGELPMEPGVTRAGRRAAGPTEPQPSGALDKLPPPAPVARSRAEARRRAAAATVAGRGEDAAAGRRRRRGPRPSCWRQSQRPLWPRGQRRARKAGAAESVKRECLAVGPGGRRWAWMPHGTADDRCCPPISPQYTRGLILITPRAPCCLRRCGGGGAAARWRDGRALCWRSDAAVLGAAQSVDRILRRPPLGTVAVYR